MFSYVLDDAFVEFVLERGSVPFIVRGSLECEANFSFNPIIGVRISGPTYRLKVVGENPEQEDPINIFVNELYEEAVFSGEIEIPKSTKQGIVRALWALERWADFLCLAMGNPKIRVEVQRPVTAVITSRRKMDPAALGRWGKLTAFHSQLKEGERRRIANALWWYRKACAAAYYSVFDSYTAYWNCLEILCNTSGSRLNKGPGVDEAIQDFLRGKTRIKAGHILECYNRFVNYSIPRQMKDALKPVLGEEQSEQFIHQCFEIQPKEDRLYQIRNDINHGNIRENTSQDLERVYLRGMLLSNVVMSLLHSKLGHPISIGMDINTLAENLANPPSAE